MARRSNIDRNQPELYLGLPARPTDDPRELLYSPWSDPTIRALMHTAPAIAASKSPIGTRLMPHDVPPHERWRWPGDKLISQRHQLDLPQLTEDEVRTRLAQVDRLVSQCGVSPLLAHVLVGRGHVEPDLVTRYLAPSIHDEVSKLPSYGPLHSAAFYLRAAILQGWHIVIVSDYDADGNCSAAIMKRSLDALGAHSTVVQPDRVLDGYGLGDTLLTRVEGLHPKVVITLDCGTSNKRQIDSLNKKGVLTIVVDHHDLPPGKTAEPDIMVNPKSDPLWFGYQELCASGLTWLLCESLLDISLVSEQREKIARDLLPLAAHGTVADVMELTGLNRALVREGFASVDSSSLIALRVHRATMRSATVTGAQVGFVVAPQLNAPGRISPGSDQGPGTAPTLEMLTTNDPERVAHLYNQNRATNEKRKELEREGLQSARELLSARQKKGDPIHLGVAVFVPSAHEGVVGLIAARVCESMQCPALVFAKDKNGQWKGSGRSIPGIHLLELLRSPMVAPLIAECGGHAAAVGLRVDERNRRMFESAFSRVCQRIFGVLNPAEDSPFSEPLRTPAPPVLETWFKSYRPDLVLTIEDLIARSDDLHMAASAIEPCGRSNPEISVLLPRVRIVSQETTKNGHLRIVVEQGARDERDWRTASRVEAIVFARSVAHQMLHRIPVGTPIDLLVQSAFDQREVFNGRGDRFSLQVLLAQSTAFVPPPMQVQRQERGEKAKRGAGGRERTPNLFDQTLRIPTFQSAAEFYERFGITCLTPAVQFRPKQFEFIAKQLIKDEVQAKENLLLSVNTGGGKTLITFMKMARVLSADPDAKVLYLTPQTDLVEQALASARLFFNLKPEEIVKVTGEVSAERRQKKYKGPGRLFIGTPQTAMIDGDISLFSMVGLDEIQMMRGDQSDRENTRYAYRWVVEKVLALQDEGNSIRLWAQSGTPATSTAQSLTDGVAPRSHEEELAALARTLRARFEVATLPTGEHKWTAGQVRLSPEFREHLVLLQDGARECYREFLASLPAWVTRDEGMTDIGTLYRGARATLRSFMSEHAKQGTGTFMPRGDFIDRYTLNHRELNKLEKAAKYSQDSKVASDEAVLQSLGALEKVDESERKWIWIARSRIHEMQVIQALFIALRSKGRAAFAHDASFLMLRAMYPAHKLEPVGAASYKVRAFRRPEVARVLGWALRESTSRSILKEFEAVYPRLHHNGEIHDRYVAAAREPLVWEEIYKNAPASIEIPRGDNAQQVDQRRKDLLEPVLLRELVNASERDPKEHHIEEFLRNVSDGSKTIVICETKFEARLLSERLTAHGLPSRWYAGRSVKRSERLSDNLEAFRRGEVRILCGTSAVETGHDIAEVSYILRYVPVTSRKKNGQAKGRAARQEGLTGEYQTVAIDDSDTDINEMTKVYRARTKLFAEERSQRRYE